MNPMMLAYLGKKHNGDSYKSPVGIKRLVDQQNIQPSHKNNYQHNSPIPKASYQQNNPNYWSAVKPDSPPKKKSFSLHKNYSDSRKPARSLKKQQKSITSEYIREQIEIVPNLQGPIKTREPLNEKIERSNNFLQQIQGITMPNYEGSKYSSKRNGIVESYSANTNQGIVRNYNQDGVAIILNLFKPEHVPEDKWKKSAFFGVYDGHGGTLSADFLRDNLHHFIAKDHLFPQNVLQSLKNGFQRAQHTILQNAQIQPQIEKSGSCAITVFLVGVMCYISNVGDSRAIMSTDGGTNMVQLSIDHKPSDQHQQARIVNSGGKIYQTKLQNPNYTIGMPIQAKSVMGPVRVLPGRLSVTRTFGDAQAKIAKYGGNINVVIAKPQIKYFKINPEIDFILLASDGVFDKVSSKQIIQLIWQTARKQSHKYDNIHQFSGLAIQNVMKLAVARKTTDNITVVLIGFEGLAKRLYEKKKEPQSRKVNSVSEYQNGYNSNNDQDRYKKRVQSKKEEQKPNYSYSNINYFSKMKQKEQKRKGSQSYYENKPTYTATSFSNFKNYKSKKY